MLNTTSHNDSPKGSAAAQSAELFVTRAQYDALIDSGLIDALVLDCDHKVWSIDGCRYYDVRPDLAARVRAALAADRHFGCFDGLRGLGLEMTRNEALSASGQGSQDGSVRHLSNLPHIAAQLDALDPSDIAAGLRESGAWDAEELANHEQNRQRAIWLAACDIRENHNEEAR